MLYVPGYPGFNATVTLSVKFAQLSNGGVQFSTSELSYRSTAANRTYITRGPGVSWTNHASITIMTLILRYSCMAGLFNFAVESLNRRWLEGPGTSSEDHNSGMGFCRKATKQTPHIW